MMRKIREIESEKEERTHEARGPKHWKLSKNDFKRVISESSQFGFIFNKSPFWFTVSLICPNNARGFDCACLGTIHQFYPGNL
jgi:hypothetical protein